MSLKPHRLKIAEALADDPNALTEALSDTTRIPAASSGLFDQNSNDPRESLANQIAALSEETEESAFDTLVEELRGNLLEQGMPKTLIDSIVTGMVNELLPFAKATQRDAFKTQFNENELSAIVNFYQANPWFITKHRSALYESHKKILAKMQEVLEHKIETDPSLDEKLDEMLKEKTGGDDKLLNQLQHVLDLDVNELTGDGFCS